MEKSSSACRLVMICTNPSKVIDPIRSRCLGIRIAAPCVSVSLVVFNAVRRRRGEGAAPPTPSTRQLSNMAVATTMISYGGFLGACGWYGAHTSGAMHSLYAGVGSGAVMVLCGANSFGEPKKGDKAVTLSKK